MRDLVKKIREVINYQDFFSRFLKLNRVGSTFMSICPFHADSQPSLSVDLEKGLWYCFGCNKGGDVFNFIMEMEDCSFSTSVKIIADMLSIDYDNSDYSFLDKREKIYDIPSEDILNSLCYFYHSVLLKTSVGKKAKEYLYSRGISDDIINEFRIGYDPKDIRNLKLFCEKKGIRLEELKGVVVRKGNDFEDILAGRIVIPIFLPNGRIIGFSGRSVGNQEPKYINTINLPKSDTLYGINFTKSYVKSKQELILVEGFFDLWSLYSLGYRNVASIMGTNLSDKQLEIIKKYSLYVNLLLDSDRSGNEAVTDLLIRFAKNGIGVKVAILDSYKDPNEAFIKDPEFLKNVFNNLQRDIDFITKRYLLESGPFEKQRFLEKKVLPFLSSISKKVVQDEYLRYFSNSTSISVKYLRNLISRSFLVKKIDQKNSTENIDFKKHGVEIFCLVFFIVNYDVLKDFLNEILELFGEIIKIDNYFEDDKNNNFSDIVKTLYEYIVNNDSFDEYIIHSLKLYDVLSKVINVSIGVDLDQKKQYFRRIINNLKRKFLLLKMKEAFKSQNFDNLNYFQEQLKKLGY